MKSKMKLLHPSQRDKTAFRSQSPKGGRSMEDPDRNGENWILYSHSCPLTRGCVSTCVSVVCRIAN